MQNITDFLINEVGMSKIPEPTNRDTELDFNKFSCVIRTGDIHYLYWSEQYKHFSIGVIHERSKGKAGGGKIFFTYVMIPKLIKTIEEAAAVINATIDKEVLKRICE